ncbi:MAG: Tfp pilus assembly protein PilV [Candidatus Omnitrophota bacterium]|jgi:Tfp pilus assembly protein PilV
MFLIKKFNNLNHRGVSLIEIVIAATLFSAIVGTILLTFAETKKFQQPEETRSVLTNIAREQLELLSEKINTVDWDVDLAVGTHILTPVAFDDKNYEINYTIQAVAGKSYRRVAMNVSEV